MNKKKLESFRQRLLDLRARSRSDLNRMIQVIQEDARPVGEHDRGTSEAVDKEIEVEHAEEEIHRNLNAALERIEQGTYGTCERCNGRIPDERLDAIPYTPYCVDCERDLESS
jgi:RNA polymerase-binding protein DksA